MRRLLVCCLLLAACHPVPSSSDGSVAPTEGVCADLGQPSIELGTGAYAFEALHPGDLVPQGYGNQGGDHVWASLRLDGIFASGAWPEDPCAEFDGVGDECEPVAPGDAPLVTVQLLAGDRVVAELTDEPFEIEAGEVLGLTAVLQSPYSTAEFGWATSIDEIDPADIDLALAAEDAELEFVATVSDACGTELTARQTVAIEIAWLTQLD